MGTRIRHIKTETRTIKGKPTVVPVLENGQEVELWSIEIPADIESAGGIPAHVNQSDPDAIAAFIVAKRQELHDAQAAAARAALDREAAQAQADLAADIEAGRVQTPGNPEE